MQPPNRTHQCFYLCQHISNLHVLVEWIGACTCRIGGGEPPQRRAHTGHTQLAGSCGVTVGSERDPVNAEPPNHPVMCVPQRTGVNWDGTIQLRKYRLSSRCLESCTCEKRRVIHVGLSCFEKHRYMKILVSVRFIIIIFFWGGGGNGRGGVMEERGGR